MVKDYEAAGYWEKKTLWDRLEEWKNSYADRCALVDEDIRISYQQLYDHALQYAAAFAADGIHEGDTVAVQLPNCAAFVEMVFGLFRIGAVPIFILPAHREKEITGIFNAASPKAYITARNFLGFDYTAMAERILKERSDQQIRYYVADELQNTAKLADVTTLSSDGPCYRDTAFLLLSGGTTNIPKLIPRTHCDYAYNFRMAAEKSWLDSDSVYLVTLPIEHNFPWGMPGVLGTLFVGGKVVIAKTSSFDEVFPLIEEEKVTITAAVPAVLQTWLEALEWEDSYDLGSLRLIQVGGAKLLDSIARKVRPAFNCTLQQVFGIAEGLITFTSPDDTEDIITTCQGKPLSEGDEIRIVDEQEQDVADGEFGQLLMKGPYTIRGYYGCPEFQSDIFTEDGFFRTGDKACITKEGNLLVDGRITDQINRGGEKVMPTEIEELLLEHEAVQEAIVVPVPDEQFGQKSFAFLKCSREVSFAEVYEFLKSRRLARYKYPDYIRFLDRIPLTNMGKTNRAELKKMAVEDINERT